MSILTDIRLAFRLFWRTPIPTGIALLSIALSVGATAVVFTAIKSVLVDPLPYARAGELVQLRSEFPKMQNQSNGDWVVWNDTQELIRRTRTLESGAATSRSEVPRLLAASSSLRPRKASCLQAASRTSAEFSPTPPENISASIPPNTATMAPIPACRRWT